MLEAYDVEYKIIGEGRSRFTRILEDTEDTERGTRQEAIACRHFGFASEAHRIVILGLAPASL